MELRNFKNKKICVALSGGVDSVALLHYMKSCQDFGYTLCAVHCEHGIRGEESLADMRFVQELCKTWGIELFLFQEDCPARSAQEKESLETSARNFRKECFARLIEEGKADYIATAHHQKDQAETVLFRLARGTSLTGMAGMRVQEGYLLRPFLRWSKAEILAYASEQGLAYRVDKTNFDESYTRNKIRLQTLSKLEEAVPGATKNLAEFALQACEDDGLLYEYANELIFAQTGENGEEYVIHFCEKPSLFRRACLISLKKLGLEKDYTNERLSAAFALQKSERGSKISFPNGIEGEKELSGIRIYRKKETAVWEKNLPKPFDESGFDGGKYEVIVSRQPIEENGEWRVLRIDGDKIPSNAVFRFRKEGDVIQSFGGGSKRLKKFLNEKKVPVEEREYLPLIAEGETENVLAVCGVEISETLKLEENAKNALYIFVRKKEK